MGGVENWLLAIVRELKALGQHDIQCDFMTLLKTGGELEAELRRLNCGIFHADTSIRRPIRSVWRMRRLMRAGKYDVVHSQSDHISGLALTAAKLAGVQKRFFHIHTTQFRLGRTASFGRRTAGVALAKLADVLSTGSFSCAKEARNAFYGATWPRSAKILYCGIDTRPFDSAADEARAAVRKEFGLPGNKRIILSVGRVVATKNLSFLPAVARHLLGKSDAVILHAGDGPQRTQIEDLVREQHLQRSFQILGRRTDVPRLMLAADAFVMPSKLEGLPLVLVEAQAAGLPIVVSDAVTEECVVIPELFHRLSLACGSSVWTDQLVEILRRPRPLKQTAALRRVAASPFDISASARNLLSEYATLT